MLYDRDIAEKIRELANHFPAIVLTGSRQTGKTTLLKSLFPNHTYVSLDLPADSQLAEESPDTFLEKYPPPILIDEVQYAPKLFRHLKIQIDSHKERKGEFILTGSQKFTLMKEVSDSLAGRIALLELEPFSTHEIKGVFHEFLKEKSIASFLCRGMYPELWDNVAMPRADFYRSYFATYIERDVRQVLNISSLRDFDRFMRVCATRTGQLLNKTSIAKDVGVSPKTINDWVSILQASNQITLLEPYFKNIGKRIVKSPKLYFTDTGLVTFLLGLNEDTLLSSPHLGAVWETFVLAELRKALFLRYPEATLWFYRDQLKEVDFLIQFGSKLHLADAKWNEVPNKRHFESLIAVKSFFEEADEEILIFSTNMNSFPVEQGLQVRSGFDIYSLEL